MFLSSRRLAAGRSGVRLVVWRLLGALRFVRTICKIYSDPMDTLWIDAAAKMGWQVQRSSEVNASWNGCGTLTIGTPETLDPDDCLAQMILHEACHALCEGPDCLGKPDWGLDNSDPAKRVHEHACLRLQAALADQVGMRLFFAATTFFRSYYDRLPADPLCHSGGEGGDDPAIAMANEAWLRFQTSDWFHPLQDALRRSAMIAAALQGVTTPQSIWHQQGLV